MKAMIALEDGTVFEGKSFGAIGEVTGEVVFNTGMMGYEEILTDPSYHGQILVMSYTQIGNYGITGEDFESDRIQVEGFVVREYSKTYSNWRAKKSLEEFLKEHDIIGIEDIDTRALVRRIRIYGAMKGIISTEDLHHSSLISKAKASPGIVGRDLVKDVTSNEVYTWPERPVGSSRYRVVLVDFGVKYSIIRHLVKIGAEVIVVPAHTTPEKILEFEPDGILLSNGPGDPEGVPYVIENVRKIINKKPIFGICLGHQILCLALGGRTYKLKFGHRGSNQPVKDLQTEKVEITSQNHGFVVDIESIKDKGLVPTHINLNDQTLEGVKHKELPIFSVQYHPEANPGPHDAFYLFKRFADYMDKAK